MKFQLLRTFILVVALQGLSVGLAAEEFVQITGENVNIRFGPSTASRVAAQARRGDVFKLRETLDQWYKVRLFTGKRRYVHRNLAKVIDYSPELPE